MNTHAGAGRLYDSPRCGQRAFNPATCLCDPPRTAANSLRNFGFVSWVRGRSRFDLATGVSWKAPSSSVCAGAGDAVNTRFQPDKEYPTMGKYFLGWIMGVPVVVLVIIYLVFN